MKSNHSPYNPDSVQIACSFSFPHQCTELKAWMLDGIQKIVSQTCFNEKKMFNENTKKNNENVDNYYEKILRTY